MANLEDPKTELKKKGEVYAGYIVHGVPRARCRAFELPPDSATDELVAAWSDKSFWEMWCVSRAHQFFLMQWAATKGTSDLLAVAKYAVRIGSLPNQPTQAAKDAIVGAAGIGGDLGAGTKDAGSAAAKDALDALHKLTRKSPYDYSAFKATLAPVLSAAPEADVTCKVLRVCVCCGLHSRHAWPTASHCKGSRTEEGGWSVGLFHRRLALPSRASHTLLPPLSSATAVGCDSLASVILRLLYTRSLVRYAHRTSLARPSGLRSSLVRTSSSRSPSRPSTLRRPPSRYLSASEASVRPRRIARDVGRAYTGGM